MSVEIQAQDENLFESQAQALVCPVNCVGVLGAGLALEFATRWPAMRQPYGYACELRRMALSLIPPESPPPEALDVGRVLTIKVNGCNIVCLPTKRHWRSRSLFEDVRLGVEALVREVDRHRWDTLAVPALGCGLGGLSWRPVRALLESEFSLHSTRVLVYEPRKGRR